MNKRNNWGSEIVNCYLPQEELLSKQTFDVSIWLDIYSIHFLRPGMHIEQQDQQLEHSQWQLLV